MIEMKKILCKNIILCEGRDEFEFLCTMINSKELKGINPKFSEDIQVFDFGGNEQLDNYLGIIKNTDGYSIVESILIIRDAEKDAGLAEKQIKLALQNNGFTSPEHAGMWIDEHPAVSYMLFPELGSSPKNGTLEDLCLEIIKEKYRPSLLVGKIAEDIDELKNDDIHLSHEFKSKLHGFFSLTDRFVGQKIGEAARTGAFDWENEKVKPLVKLVDERL